MLTIGELKEFIKDLPNEVEVVMESVVINDRTYTSKIEDISCVQNHSTGEKYLRLQPKEIVVK